MVLSGTQTCAQTPGDEQEDEKANEHAERLEDAHALGAPTTERIRLRSCCRSALRALEAEVH